MCDLLSKIQLSNLQVSCLFTKVSKGLGKVREGQHIHQGCGQLKS